MTQKDKILKYIAVHGSITSMEAYSELGITQLGARIFELKEKGFKFSKKREKNNGKIYDRYFWEE